MRRKETGSTTRWIVGALTLGCVALMLRAGFYFHHHDYYIMPFVPAMALMAAVGLEVLPCTLGGGGAVGGAFGGRSQPTARLQGA